MKNFNAILVPVDFSAVSEISIRRALDTALHCRSRELHLVSVVDINTVGYFVAADTCLPMDFQLMQAEKESAQEKLQQLVSTLPAENDVQYITAVIEGSFAPHICDYVTAHKIELVVMGTSGTGGIQEFIFGSNAQDLAAACPCPVLTLHPTCRKESIRKILVPVEDFYPENKLSYAVTLARTFEAVVHLVCRREQFYAENKITYTILFQAVAYLESEKIPYQSYAAEGNNITDILLRYAEKEGIDLILVNPGEESKLTGKIIAASGGQIVNHAPVPVLTVQKSEPA